MADGKIFIPKEITFTVIGLFSQRCNLRKASVQRPVFIGRLPYPLFKQTGEMLRILKSQFIGNLTMKPYFESIKNISIQDIPFQTPIFKRRSLTTPD
jgi:hypothetical protein